MGAPRRYRRYRRTRHRWRADRLLYTVRPPPSDFLDRICDALTPAFAAKTASAGNAKALRCVLRNSPGRHVCDFGPTTHFNIFFLANKIL